MSGANCPVGGGGGKGGCLDTLSCLLDGILLHCRVTPSIKFAGTHFYTWVERDSVRVKCSSLEHDKFVPSQGSNHHLLTKFLLNEHVKNRLE